MYDNAGDPNSTVYDTAAGGGAVPYNMAGLGGVGNPNYDASGDGGGGHALYSTAAANDSNALYALAATGTPDNRRPTARLKDMAEARNSALYASATMESSASPV